MEKDLDRDVLEEDGGFIESISYSERNTQEFDGGGAVDTKTSESHQENITLCEVPVACSKTENRDALKFLEHEEKANNTDLNAMSPKTDILLESKFLREKETVRNEKEEDYFSITVSDVLESILRHVVVTSSSDRSHESEAESSFEELSFIFLKQMFDEQTPANNSLDDKPCGSEANSQERATTVCQEPVTDTSNINNSQNSNVCSSIGNVSMGTTTSCDVASNVHVNEVPTSEKEVHSSSDSQLQYGSNLAPVENLPSFQGSSSEDHNFDIIIMDATTSEVKKDPGSIKQSDDIEKDHLRPESKQEVKIKNCCSPEQSSEVTTFLPEDINTVTERKSDEVSMGELEVLSCTNAKNGVTVETEDVNVVYVRKVLSTETTEAGCEEAIGEKSRFGTLDEPEGEDMGCVVVPNRQLLPADGICDTIETSGAEVKGEKSLDEIPEKDIPIEIHHKRKLPVQRTTRSLSFSSALKFGKSEVATLVEEHLKDIYVPFESVKTQLVRQCRDILLCEYQGNFQKFKEMFLIETAILLRRLKLQYIRSVCVCQNRRNSLATLGKDSNNICPYCEGWPLCYNRRLVVHIGVIDEAFLKPGDFYFCVREAFHTEEEAVCFSGVNSRPDIFLSFRYRKRQTIGENAVAAEEVLESRIDETKFGSLFTMDWLESTASELMISDERLTSVLQHLLLSVERGIERLEWDSVSKVWQACAASVNHGPRCCHTSVANTKDSSVQTSSPEDDVPEKSDCSVLDDQQKDSTCSFEENNSHANREDSCPGEAGPRPCLNGSGYYENGPLNIGLRKKSRDDDVSVLRMSCASPLPTDDEPDDGYYEHTLTQPTTLSQVDPDLLHSQVALLPGCRDSCGRSIVIISGAAMKNNSPVSACHLAQLFLYFHTIPKKDTISRGFLVLIDANEVSEEHWNVLDETFCLLEANITNALSQVLLYSPSVKPSDISKFFPTSRIQCEVVNSYDKLLTFIRKDQLLVSFGGSYIYDHQEWISFRKFLEPFINGCRLSGRNLVCLLEELKGSRLPPSSSLTHQMIEKQKKSMQLTFQDEQLRHLEEEGDTILKELESYRTKSPHNTDYRDNLERTSILYDELRKAMSKLSRLADKRLQRLEDCLQRRTFQEESSQVLSWLCRKGTESLEKHQAVADSLGAIKEQEEEFEKFYFLAMRQIERGNDLLEEASVLSQEHSLPKIQEESYNSLDETAGVQELASSLRQHLGSFSEKLEGTRERIEDTAKCYQLMDKSYEWALEAMRFVSQMGLANTGSPEGIMRQIKCLQEYLEDHLPISDDTFQEIVDLATKLGNDKLVEQCKVAKLRCQETVDLIQARQSTLLKVKQQMEVDSFRGPLWEGDDGSPTPRTTRSNSQPVNMWTPPGATGPYPLCLGHFRRRSDSTALSAPQNYGSPINSYTSFPSSYYPTVKDSYHLDSYVQNQKDDQLLQRGLITEDLTYQGPVASISKGYLDSRLGHKEGTQSISSSSSSSCSSNKGPTSVLRSSGRGTYSVSANGGVNIRWGKKHARKSQTWQIRDEALEKIKNEVKEQNALLQVEKLNLHNENSDDSTHSNSETDFSPSSENSCKVPHSSTRPDPPRGPVPVNTHLLTQASTPDSPDSSTGNTEVDATKDAAAKAKKTLMLIMKEMIQTERDYVNSLEYIIKNYIPELLREDIPQALRGQRNVVFGNIEKIYEFHSQYFLNELELCENTPFVVGQCFLKYEPQFYLYALYNKNKPKSDALMIEYGNAFFRKKQLELEDKMDLASYLLKPVQRMGKYALLLKQLLKECPEREAEHQDLKIAEEMVRFQLRHGNDLLAMDALRDCDVNVKEQGRLLRQDEFLVWQGRSRKSLRHVFLFEDLILFSKARRDPQRKGYEMYQYKQSIKTTDMGLTEQVGDSPTKFEIWFRKRKLNDTYLLQAPNPDVKAAWVHELSKLLWKQALRNREMRLAEMSSMGIGNKPCLDIKPTEDQIRDRSISIHQLTRAPRFRNSIGMPPYDVKVTKRPHSIISVSSSSSSGSSQSSFTFYGTLNLGFEPGDSPRPLHRSLTQQSQCSTESGFCTDASTMGDSPTDSDRIRHKKAERSDSLLSSDSMSTSTTPSELNCSSCEEHPVEESITTSM